MCFSIKELYSSAWNIYKNHWIFLSLIYLAAILIGLPFSLLKGIAVNVFITSIWNVIGFIVQAVVYLGLIKVSLDLAEDNTCSLKGFFAGMVHFWNFLVAQLFLSLIFIALTFSTIILLALGGFSPYISLGIGVAMFGVIAWLWIRWIFLQYYIVDQSAGPIEGFKMSWTGTSGKEWSLFLLILSFVLFNLVGLLLIGIGLLITLPMTLIMMALAYKSIVGQCSVE